MKYMQLADELLQHIVTKKQMFQSPSPSLTSQPNPHSQHYPLHHHHHHHQLHFHGNSVTPVTFGSCRQFDCPQPLPSHPSQHPYSYGFFNAAALAAAAAAAAAANSSNSANVTSASAVTSNSACASPGVTGESINSNLLSNGSGVGISIGIGGGGSSSTSNNNTNNNNGNSSLTNINNNNNDNNNNSNSSSNITLIKPSHLSSLASSMLSWPAPSKPLGTTVDESNIMAAQQYDWRIRARDRPIVELEDRELWTEFYNKTTEMVITKTGRRMFPAFKVRIKGLDLTAKYIMLLDIVLSNENRYKYYHNQWIRSGKAEISHHIHSPYIHPDSPNTGEEWMSKPISFHKIKLSNTRIDKDDVIILNSMHKYIPKLYLVRAQNLLHTNYCHWDDFSFEETQFIAVTAYQNDQITKLKINYNPFAKGFRESSSLKKEKRILPEYEISNHISHKTMSSSIVNDFVILRNKYFKQFALRNRGINKPFQFLPRTIDGSTFNLSQDQNETQCDKHSEECKKQGFLVNDLID